MLSADILKNVPFRQTANDNGVSKQQRQIVFYFDFVEKRNIKINYKKHTFCIQNMCV